MPIVKASGQWKEVEIEGDFFNDENFHFLSCIEELDPNDCPSEPEQRKKLKRPIEVNKPTDKNTDVADKPCSLLEEPKKKKKKKDNKISTASETQCELNGETITWKDLYLPDEVLRAIEDQNFDKPTEIQKLAIPSALHDQLDVMGAAETGSGKTLAFALPIISTLLTETDYISGLRALILTPTRELAVQIKQHIINMLKYTNIKIAAIVGGLSVQKQERILKQKPAIIVATPGRFWALHDTATNTYLADLSKLRFLVIDETDRMVEKGHFDELENILNAVKNANSVTKRQTFLFSATLTYVHSAPARHSFRKTENTNVKEKLERIIQLSGIRTNKCKIIDITREFGTAASLVETRVNCDDLLDKDTIVYYFLHRYPGRTLIFTNSIDASRRLHAILTKLQVPMPLLLHAKMIQKQRLKNLERFAANEYAVLISTDVAARGLDIKNIEHVIHYNVPKTAETYVHRSGRTARASKSGISVMLVDRHDAQFYRRIITNLNRSADLPIMPLGGDQLMSALRTRMNLASQLDTLTFRKRITKSKDNWLKRAAIEADLDVDFNEIDDEESAKTQEMRASEAKVKKLSHQLKIAMAQRLPKDVEIRTRYINHKLVEKSKAQQPNDAIKNLEQYAKEKKKKIKGVKINQHNLKKI